MGLPRTILATVTCICGVTGLQVREIEMRQTFMIWESKVGGNTGCRMWKLEFSVGLIIGLEG